MVGRLHGVPMYHYDDGWRLRVHLTGETLSNQPPCHLDLLNLQLLGYGGVMGLEELPLKAADNTPAFAYVILCACEQLLYLYNTSPPRTIIYSSRSFG